MHQLRRHKLLRPKGKLLNMLNVRGRKVRSADVAKESLSHADDSEAEEDQDREEEDDLEGRGEAEGREEDEEDEKITT